MRTPSDLQQLTLCRCGCTGTLSDQHCGCSRCMEGHKLMHMPLTWPFSCVSACVHDSKVSVYGHADTGLAPRLESP